MPEFIFFRDRSDQAIRYINVEDIAAIDVRYVVWEGDEKRLLPLTEQDSPDACPWYILYFGEGVENKLEICQRPGKPKSALVDYIEKLRSNAIGDYSDLMG